MLTPIIATASSFIDQLGSTIIKKSENKAEHPATIWESALISMASGSIIIFGYVLFKSNLYLDADRTWVFIPRIGLEILQIYVTFTALKISELSSYNFLRVFSIVFVIIFEILFLGTVLTPLKYLGILIVFVSILTVFRHGVKNIAGWGFLLVSAINGGLLMALTKYQFSFNDAYLNEAIVRIFLIVILAVAVRFNFKKTPGNRASPFLENNKSLLSLIPIRAVVGILNLAALNLGAAAVYTTADRAGSVLSGVILGHSMFNEKSFVEKLFIALGIIAGLALLILG
ncbi:hypothetical protein A2473_03185 [candidate division WWE3 bacterium RIFOXYC2_FULL_42_13]|uniref:EamA domain-containing protein n=2 Tax=Katanobacteria TaxID=422282 RepID=A0A3D0ZNR3_UNCKA|nr:MAG: hypothetical protein A2245_00670 [candidate division WWE3 bacterium RIFOXYA2_FULL_43_12]OGC72570.1 MAG: hypothetical protein A2473_03185 [candidate division WWE3 bacterium RIFOXYC2_FULL_42_13]OGC72888.1 MAG: hypothetical protein A2337_03755 [candidate division WWE3 bacterium RIFOXYB2_FULL_43_9]HBY09941.1 hypothetical protein [candidate division WWE3 bacterium]HCC41911.1 hypothetical protein [candidate division WWE3 bacterium]